ncbi:uncharacterized protein LOC127129679 [Lathyrus oleraceus]|uniref:uncharacterized protein LOC127129679 n=1 Tax=Pisum sativum TaxID=3888 RepID=UPI0021D32EFE|nr:uncharacterized protein LOC127129679 [Pisum sativum]
MRSKKEIELLELKQRNSMITMYVAKFEDLVMFCPYYNNVVVEGSKCIKIYDEDSRAGSSYYKSINDTKGNIQICGKSYGTVVDKWKQRVPDKKKQRGGETPTSVRCFNCGEYGYHAPECKSTTVNYFKSGKPGHRAADCRSNNLTCFNYREQCHISTQCEKPKKDQSRGKVFMFPVAEANALDNLIRGRYFINNTPLITIIDTGVTHSFIYA